MLPSPCVTLLQALLSLLPDRSIKLDSPLLAQLNWSKHQLAHFLCDVEEMSGATDLILCADDHDEITLSEIWMATCLKSQ